jgi:3-mercaptopyruvate sulfurtransferase SseA
MKTGLILYIVGEECPDDEVDLNKAVKKLGIRADRVAVISPETGYFDVMDAWWFLTTKGMHKIVCSHAEFSGRSGLQLTGRELRLCG